MRIADEVEEYLAAHRHLLDEQGRQAAVGNGKGYRRELLSSAGSLSVRQLRVRHRDGGKFTSAILPPFARRASSINVLIPALYLRGISTANMQEALEAILSNNAAGLSSTNVTRLAQC
jgi:transposase-like protein